MWAIFKKFIDKVLKELWDTLSIRPSHLSSKRIERMIFTFTVVTITWIVNIYNIGVWTATDHVITLTPLLIAAGYNVFQERKEKQDSIEETHDKEV
jgi:hypothetical protein